MGSGWDKKRVRKEIEMSTEEFFDLTSQLMDIVVKYCVRALKTFEVAKGEELNHIQINQIATKEVQAVIEQISNPEFYNLATKKAEITYLQEKPNYNP